ncbi:MAG TPA: OmpA family protein [Gammaproteobacteria bacterium]|nr:OmpA family protein [Gammaproteobacteria bacterium]
MIRPSLALVPLLLLLLSACAPQPTKSDTLQQAQQAVGEAESNAAVSRYAPVALRDAQETLRHANRLAQESADKQDVDHYAYLALKRAQIAQAQARREVLAQSLQNAEQQRAQIQLEARDRALEQARQEAEASKKALEEAQRELADLRPKQTERGLVLTLGEVLFPFDSAELQAGSQRALDRLARYLQANPGNNILIEGHTDSTGDAAYNQRLSERRAEAVARALAQRGVDSSRIRAAGLGENFPVADNKTAAGRSENRRVEVVVAQNKMPQSRQEMQQAQK